MTEKKIIGVKVGFSRLDPNPRQTSRDTQNEQNRTLNRSQASRESQQSVREVNARAIAQARQHLTKMQEQRRI